MMRRLLLPKMYGSLYVCPAGNSPKEQHETAYNLLYTCAELYFHKEHTEKPSLSRTESGKPYFTEFPDVHFNLSHCNGMAVCLLSKYECGVDVEQCRKLRPKVVEKVFSPDEKRALKETDNPDFLFTRLWTLKESYVKALGKGIAYPMKTLNFQLDGDFVYSNRPDACFWHLTEGNFAISMCILRN
ncbi:MAG TPA: phosphopantetheine-protein transferase [Ruminococcus sp.]|nr:phosphopantetheine-protein transferase [Ruminococcus sp.]